MRFEVSTEIDVGGEQHIVAVVDETGVLRDKYTPFGGTGSAGSSGFQAQRR
jgi:hypothetical protein